MMFRDVCFETDKENIIRTGKKLGITEFCFLNSDMKCSELSNTKKNPDKLIFLPLGKNIQKKPVAYYFTPNRSGSFHHASKITQTDIKRLRDSGSMLLLPAFSINEDTIEEIRFLVKLCRKYKAVIGLASFARDRYGLRDRNSLESLAKTIGFFTDELASCFSSFDKLCSDIFL